MNLQEPARHQENRELGEVSSLPQHTTVTIDHPDPNIGSFKITSEQFRSLRLRYEQEPDGTVSFEEFLCRARPCGAGGDQYIGLAWCGMWLGIEPDGYTHS